MVELGVSLPTMATIQTGGFVLVIVLIFGILALLFLFAILYISRFNIRVDVEDRKGNNIVEYETRAGIVQNRKTGVKEFIMWRGRWRWGNPIKSAVPPNDLFRLDKKGKPIIRVIKDSIDTFKVVPPNPPEKAKDGMKFVKPSNSVEMPKPVDLDWYNWASQTLKGMAPRFRNDRGLLQEHAGLISFGGVLIVFLIGSFFMWNAWVDGTANLERTSANVKETSLSQERTAKIVQGTQIIEPATGNTNNNDAGGG